MANRKNRLAIKLCIQKRSITVGILQLAHCNLPTTSC